MSLDRTTAAQARKDLPTDNPQFCRGWGNRTKLTIASLRTLPEPGGDASLALLVRLWNNRETLLPEIRRLANRGDPALGVAAIVQWLTELAERGHHEAQRLLGIRKVKGKGRSPAARAHRRMIQAQKGVSK
ncbi:MAG: hypothetical protein WDN69_05090 [Aliidongia sp.]